MRNPSGYVGVCEQLFNLHLGLSSTLIAVERVEHAKADFKCSLNSFIRPYGAAPREKWTKNLA